MEKQQNSRSKFWLGALLGALACFIADRITIERIEDDGDDKEEDSKEEEKEIDLMSMPH